VTVLQLGIAGWIAGVLAYVGALALLYGQGLSRGDAGAVLFSSLIVFALCYVLLYLPVLRLVRRGLGSSRPAWAFALVACAIGVIPTALIARFYGGSWHALATPEAGLFFILFAVVGLVVGLGFPFLRQDRQTHRRIDSQTHRRN
jgi:hypothetical protein